MSVAHTTCSRSCWMAGFLIRPRVGAAAEVFMHVNKLEDGGGNGD